MSATLTSPGRVMPDRTRSPRRQVTPTRPPRRVSGPVRGRGAAGRTRTATAPRESLALGGRALALVRGLPDHSVIDQLVRGRAWIPVLGVLLAGIVAMQVEILKLGSTMGRAMVRTTALQTRNEWLQASVAGLADDQRIERLAAGMGMTMTTPDSLVFLSGHSGGVGRALNNLRNPDPTGFLSQLAAQAAAASALMPAAPVTTSPTAGTTAAGTTSAGATAPSTGTAASSPTSATAAPTTAAVTAPAASTPGVTPAAPATTTGSTAGPTAGGSATGGGAPATGAAGLASAGSAQSGGATGG